MDKISFTIVGEDKPADFYVLEQTRIGGFSYLLVTDQEEGNSDAWILRDRSADGEEEAVYEIVEDEEQLQAVAKVFEQMLDDVEIE